MIGALKDDNRFGVDVGAVYVFARSENGWRQSAKLLPSDGAEGDAFGGNVALYGGVVAIGAINDDDNGENSGSVYIFEQRSGSWKQTAKIIAPDGAAGDAFGQSIALWRNKMVIGAPHDDDFGDSSGSVYTFVREQERWQPRQKLLSPNGRPGDVFGINVDQYDKTIAVGADLDDEVATDAGAVFIFTLTDDGWKQRAKLTAPDGAETDIFGVRVSLFEDTALVSARRDDDPVHGRDSGSVYVFRRNQTGWHLEAKLTASDGAADDRFGQSVAMGKNTAIVGAIHADEAGENAGAAYLFTRSGENWDSGKKVIAGDPRSNAVFGWTISLDDDVALISAARDPSNGENSGAAYIIDIPQDRELPHR
jgi:hypothetical protein